MAMPSKLKARHKAEGQVKVRCNAIYKTDKNINIKLTTAQALQLAKGLIQKSLLVMDEGADEEVALHVWSTGGNRLYCGMALLKKTKS
jgi:hypothetical protein